METSGREHIGTWTHRDMDTSGHGNIGTWTQSGRGHVGSWTHRGRGHIGSWTHRVVDTSPFVLVCAPATVVTS